MEERSNNKTIMCSVFFLDIVEYAKMYVEHQILLKDRFNNYLSSAIRDVPLADRIILDTGDGAAINFIGDVEDALKAALSMRESLLAEDPNVGLPLRVRMGINLGPVRLVRDSSGRPNIVGDGINVAQRVMGFADPAQILVSHSYYEAVSRLSPQYAGMFHYQGSRTDKHVREHEVYAIGYPGDITTHRRTFKPVIAEPADKLIAGMVDNAKAIWRYVVIHFNDVLNFLILHYQKAGNGLRALYLGVVAATLLLFVALLIDFARHDQTSVAQTALDKGGSRDIQPSSAASVASVQENAESNSSAPILHSKLKPKTKNHTGGKKSLAKHSERQQGTKSQVVVEQNVAALSSNNNGSGSYVQVSCKEGTEVFVDGARKGRIGSKSLTINVLSGAHTVIVSNASGGIYTQNVELVAGKTVHIRPGFCD